MNIPQTLRDSMSDKHKVESEIQTIYVYRSVSPKFGTRSTLSHLEEAAYGSFITGGRFNRPGEFRVLYLSLDRDTCLAEREKYAQKGNLTLKEMPPHPVTVFPWKIRLSCVLDLTDTRVRETLQIDEETICRTDWETLQNYYEVMAATQRLGKLAKDFGFAALLTPSAAKPGGKNLNVFIDNIVHGHDVCEACYIDEFPS